MERADKCLRSRRSAAERTIKRCREEDILAAFLAKHEAEVYNKKGRLTLDEASEEAQMPIADFRQRMTEYERANAQ